ncbi:zinc finger MYM-type protein 1-like [Belonocnema kinseyi]|uniref:zinc finger MYM-type protein 1-like n=1 Tax=Belonocnema kinseyi TaxID=2817044 RepID=UPI00143D264D|nr:zinc finger MYM-type protein 1-like [Belonocnema kinseyi]
MSNSLARLVFTAWAAEILPEWEEIKEESEVKNYKQGEKDEEDQVRHDMEDTKKEEQKPVEQDKVIESDFDNIEVKVTQEKDGMLIDEEDEAQAEYGREDDEASKDPALWLWPMNDDSVRNIILDKGYEYLQNNNSNFSASVRQYKHEKLTRSLTLKLFKRTFANQETHKHDELILQIKPEVEYWRKILKRLVEVVRFLCERGLAFHGTHEEFGSPDNGNYPGLLELLAKFDPILAKHIDLYDNKGQARKVFDHIVTEIMEAKYFGLIADSTPDVSHVDQLSIIIRYCLHGQVYERFLQFLPISSHTGDLLSRVILNVLSDNGICISNCRGQSYDNASNMSGKYAGVQVRIKEVNPLALYVPCTAHSLNLVGTSSVNICIDAITFFEFVAGLYAFFVASPHRWSCHDDATSAIFRNCEGIYATLSVFVESNDEKPDARFEASVLQSQMRKLEIAFMIVFWHEVLDRFNKTSKFLQTVELDVSIGNSMLKSLVHFLESLPDKFEKIEESAMNLSSFVAKHYQDENK